MKPNRILAMIVLVFLGSPLALAQQSQTETSKPAPETTTEVPLKLQVVLNEFDGTRKVSSLPYSMNILGTGLRDRREAKLRYGLRVPIGQGSSYTYQDVGTNIDCTAIQREDNTYRLDLIVERSSVSVPASNGTETEWKPGSSGPTPLPVIRAFRDEFTVIAPVGQTVEGTSAADPLTGHVLKIDVTLDALK
ncbi:MAG: hypothetical protein ACRD8A_09505 [Candidatus Acidiferrales bacterium]